jgi:integrase
MPATKLTAAFCEAVKPKAGTQSAYPDSDVRGLELRVSGDGRKTWSFRYRTKDGRQSRVTLGVYSREYDLAKARAEARKARVVVDAGGDPAEVRRATKEAAKSEPIRSFGDLAEAYFTATERGRYRPKRPNTLKNERAVYRVHIQPALARLRLESVTERSVTHSLEAMLDAGITSQALRAQAVIRQMFRYAVKIKRLPSNPVSDLEPIVPQKARARIYTDAELRAVWNGIADPSRLKVPPPMAERRREGARVSIGPAMRIALQLVFLLLQRRSEVLGMALSELDLAQRVWVIPASRMKSKRPHAVPLSDRVAGLIEQAITLNAGRDTPFVFPSRINVLKPMNGSSMNHAMGDVLLALGIEDATIHDIRRTGSTAMTSERLAISPFIRSKVLGHMDAGGGATVSALHYDANAYLSEKRRALDAWQGLLAQIVEGVEPQSNVRALRG